MVRIFKKTKKQEKVEKGDFLWGDEVSIPKIYFNYIKAKENTA